MKNTDPPAGAVTVRTPLLRADQNAPPRRDSHGMSRRMKLLARQGCFGVGPQGVYLCRATTVKELQDAYRLVHDSFVEQGFIIPQPGGLRIRPYEALPDTATFVAKTRDEQVVGVTSVVMDSTDLGIPSEQAFGSEIAELRQTRHTIAEITNWAIDPEYRRTSVLTELIRCYIAHLLAQQCQDAVAAISPGHLPFYRLLGFEQAGSERSYSQTIHDPVVLVRLSVTELMERFDNSTDGDDDLAVLKRYYMADNPYHQMIETWVNSARGAFSDPALLRHLFAENSGLLHTCDKRTLAVIREQWGEDLFLDVVGHSVIHDTFSQNNIGPTSTNPSEHQ